MSKENILIAEFMDLESELLAKGLFQKKYKHSFSSHGFSDWASEEMLEFNSSWDWLMPVVEKIESLNHDVLIYNGYVLINTNHDWFECNPEILGNRYTDRDMFEINNYSNNKLETIYLSVIEFIKWYNNK